MEVEREKNELRRAIHRVGREEKERNSAHVKIEGTAQPLV